jgi:hypothetical protein
LYFITAVIKCAADTDNLKKTEKETMKNWRTKQVE